MKYILVTVLLGSIIALGIYGAALTSTHDVYINPAAVLTGVTAPIPQSPVLLLVGDIMLGRNVENLMEKYGDDYPFKNIQSLLKEPDAVVANLEGPVMENHKHTPSLSVRFAFDERIPKLLADNNIKIVSLANNHTFDYGGDGYASTVRFVQAGGVDYIGHPFAINDKYVLRKTIKGKKFVFVGFNFTNPNFNKADARDFITLTKHAPDEFLIALIHGGDEYKLTSNLAQKEFYRSLLDKGVDLVVAHHPHVVQEIEVYKNKAIFYSLGNFIFDQYFSKDVQEELAVKMSFTDGKVRYDLIPVKSIKSQPEVMDTEESKDFLTRLAARSSKAYQAAIQAGSLELTYTPKI